MKIQPKTNIHEAATVKEDSLALFEKACDYVKTIEKGAMGIGTLSEKTLHATLKYYYAPDPEYHEIKIGTHVADICVDGEITEIQTRNLGALRPKLTEFLKEHEVTVVHPMPHIKWISWIDMETGEVSKPRKSGKHGNIYNFVPELYKLKMFLQHPNLHFVVPLLDVLDTRYLNGYGKDKKKKSTREERIPQKLVAEYQFYNKEDFLILLPDTLPEQFTSIDLAREAGISKAYASTFLGILNSMELVIRTGQTGRAYTYIVNK